MNLDGPQKRSQALIDVVIESLILSFVFLLLLGSLPRAWFEVVASFAVPALMVILALALARSTRTAEGLRLTMPSRGAKQFVRFTLYTLILVVLFDGLYIAVLALLEPGVFAEVLRQLGQVWPLDTKELWTTANFRGLISVPVGEEFLFRGWLLTWLGRREAGYWRIGRLTVSRANLLTTLSFVAYHVPSGNLIGLPSVFLFSLLVGVAKERSGSLLLPIWCHFLANLVGF